MIKRGERITLDFTGTDPQSTGPINWPADYAGGAFLIKWIAPILRNLADTPERAAEIHVNEGVCEVFDVMFPPKGTLITPEWPAATNARSFVLLRCLGLLAGVVAQAVDGRMPADQETIRYTGFFGIDHDGKPFLSREVLGGGSGGRYYADGNDAIHIVPDSRNQPAEFTETRFPLLVEKLALRTDSGGAGKRRGGLGYEKHYRALVDCRTIVTADRVRLGCYGVNGGKAGAAVLRHRRHRRRRRAISAAWSTASRCSPARSCAWSPPAAAAGAIRSSASRSWCCRRDRRQGVARGCARGLRRCARAEEARTRSGRRRRRRAGAAARPAAASRPMIDRGADMRRCCAARWRRGRARPDGQTAQRGESRMAIEVAKVELKTVQDASGLEACIRQGQFTADEVIAVIGKTEGNGGVNDFTRILADQAFRRVLLEHGGRREAEHRRAVPMVWSGGCDGVITPHATIFARNGRRPDAGRPRSRG